MQRMITASILIVASFFAAHPADAFWGHHWGRCGWGGWGYRGYGWGGYGYRGFGWGYPGYGYGGFGYGGYAYPYYSVGYAPSFGCANYCGYGYGTTVGLGYPGYGMYSATYVPPLNLIVTSRPAAVPATAAAATAAKPASSSVTGSKSPTTATALQKFLGLKVAPPTALVSAPAAKSLDDVLARLSSVESRRKAERLIADGDEFFHTQNYHSALQKYKLASATAPDVAEALWRQGHALVATHNYDLATTVFKRAIARTEDMARGGFGLSDLYAGAKMTKTQHLESLAEWALSRSNSPDSYFLIGLFLHYDGQPARAEKFFQKASDLAGISGGHIAVFLAPAEEAARPRSESPGRPAAAAPFVPTSVATEL